MPVAGSPGVAAYPYQCLSVSRLSGGSLSRILDLTSNLSALRRLHAQELDIAGLLSARPSGLPELVSI